MFVKIFRDTNNAGIVLLPLIAIGFWSQSFLYPFQFQSGFEPLSNIIYTICFENQIAIKLLGLVLIIAEAFLINQITNKYTLCINKTNLPGFIYILLMSWNFTILYCHPVLVVNLILILLCIQFFELDKEPKTIRLFFNTGIILGVTSLIYFSSLYIVFLIFILSVILGNVKWRDWISLIIGMLVPHAFYVAYLFFTNQVQNIFFLNPEHYQILSFQLVGLRKYVLVIIFTLVGLLLLTFHTYIVKIRSMLSKSRSLNWVLVFAILLPILLIPFSFTNNNIHLNLIAFPCSIFFSSLFLQYRKKWMAEILLLLVLGILIFGYISTYNLMTGAPG